jgi:peptidoglycan/LPS O-acetylase OafA/YrhL
MEWLSTGPGPSLRARLGLDGRPKPADAPGHVEGPTPETPPGAKPKDQSIETLRGLAIFAVVVGHAIGDWPTTGLRVAPDSVYRHLYNATTNLRMPMFFVISGFLYAHRPVVPGRFAEFARGKARLLVPPLLSVATLQYLMKAVVPGVNIPTQIRDIWRIYVFGFDQFWFSQATLTTFAVVLLAERFSPISGPSRWPVYLILAILYDVLVPKVTFFSLNAFSLMVPFFFLGCFLYRPPARLRGPLVVVVFLTALTIQQLIWFGRLTLGGREVLALNLCEGLSFAFLLFRFRWTSPRLAILGGFAYPIYLFHVFGTASSRILATQLGIEHRAILLTIGVACGLGLPVAVHLLFRRHVILRRVFLGGR